MAFIITVAVAGNDLFLRNEIAFVVGSSVAAAIVGIALTIRMRSGAATLEDLVEVVEHETLEI